MVYSLGTIKCMMVKITIKVPAVLYYTDHAQPLLNIYTSLYLAYLNRCSVGVLLLDSVDN